MIRLEELRYGNNNVYYTARCLNRHTGEVAVKQLRSVHWRVILSCLWWGTGSVGPSKPQNKRDSTPLPLLYEAPTSFLIPGCTKPFSFAASYGRHDTADQTQPRTA